MSTTTDTYTLARHERDHWQGNRPADCGRCHPTPAAPEPWDGDDYASPFPGLLIAIPASLTILAVVLWAAAWVVTSAPLNGFTPWAIIGAATTALGIAAAERQVRHGRR